MAMTQVTARTTSSTRRPYRASRPPGPNRSAVSVRTSAPKGSYVTAAVSRSLRWPIRFGATIRSVRRLQAPNVHGPRGSNASGASCSTATVWTDYANGSNACDVSLERAAEPHRTCTPRTSSSPRPRSDAMRRAPAAREKSLSAVAGPKRSLVARRPPAPVVQGPPPAESSGPRS